MTSSDGPSAQHNKPGKAPGSISHRAFRQVHNHNPVGVIAIGAGGIVTYANATALTFTGLSEKEIQGRSFLSLFRDDSTGHANEARLLRLEEITDQEFIVKTKPEKEQWALVSSKVYRDDQDDVQTYFFIRDISVLKKKEKLRSYLNQAAEALAKTRDTKSALDQIAQFIMPKFATWFTIDILKDGRLESVLLKHEDPNKIEWARQYRKDYPPDPNGNTGSAVVLKSGKPGFLAVITDEMITAAVPDPVQLKAVKQIGMRSVIIAPMSNKDRVTGVANFISSNDGHYFDEADLEFAINFANLVGLALENTRLNEEAAVEIALRKEGEEKFHFLTDAIPHKLWTSGQDGRATYYNQQWYDYTGIYGVEPLKEKIWGLLHFEDRAIAAVQWPLAIQKGEATEMEQRLLRYDGVYRWHLTRFLPHQNENGQILLWVGTSTDIHEQKMLELELASFNEELATTNEELTAVNEELASTNEELKETHIDLQQIIREREIAYEKIKELNEKKDEFIGLASHELKTPLTSISGYLQILSRLKTDDKRNKFLDRTVHQVQKLTTLVNDLLDVSKIEAGKLQLAKEKFDIKKVIEDAIELIEHSYEKSGIILDSAVAGCIIEADSQRVEQVLINLLTNAIKYSPGADQVIVSLMREKDGVRIGVKDFGIGIPPNKLNQVFSRFYRIEDSDPNISGLGIGLYLSHEIITRHNGKIWVESEMGKGSTFWFTLPIK